MKCIFHRSVENNHHGYFLNSIQRVKGMNRYYFSLQNKYQEFKTTYIFFWHSGMYVCLQVILLQNIENVLTSMWMDVHISPRSGLCQCQIKVIHVFQMRWKRNAVCQGVCIKECAYGVFRGLSLPGGFLRVGMRPGGWLLCVIEKKRLSFREHWGLEHSYHLECLSGLIESGEAFYISQAIACHSFSFSCPLYFPLPV